MVTPFSRRGLIRATGAAALLPVAANAAEQPAFIRLSLNENAFGPADSAKRAMMDAVDGGWMYDYEDALALKRMIAQREGLKPENVFIAEGSGELLKLAGLIYGANGAEIVAAMPTFPMLAQYAARNGGKIVWVNVDSAMRHDLPAMQAKISERTGVIYVCNPNNPTGTLCDPEALRKLVAAIPSKAIAVVDEAYMDFADDPARHALVDQVKAERAVLITRTFSKLHGLAGLRVGYGLARADIIKRLEAVRISIPNRMGLRAAVASYQDTAFAEYSRKAVRTGAAMLAAFFTDVGAAFTPTQGNFMMFDTKAPATDFYESMRGHSILVQPVTEPFDTWVRVTVGRPEHMQAFVTAARNVLVKKT